ncbi:MAG: hypothetical protein JXR64_06710 [Spirochaetales bacterium]|nr:hypothetical protein [Spirochaetales bacterium]
MKKILTIFLTLFILFPVVSEPQKIYSLNRYRELYRVLELLQTEAGISQLSYSYPFTGKEIEGILSRIDYNTLSNNSQILYQEIINQLEIDISGSGFRGNVDGSINAETYLQTNKENDEWIYDYNSRKPVIELDLSAGITNYFWADVALPLQKGLDFNRYTTGAETNISLLWNLDQIDAQFPFTAISSLGGDHWNIQFGRDILNYGVGRSGAFVISDDGSFHDYLKASTFWNNFKYTMTFVNIDPIDVDGLDPYVEYISVEDVDGNPVTVETKESRKKLKIFIDHTFEFKPHPKLSIAINEVTVRGGGEVTLGYLNPLMIMHNLALTDRRYTILGNSLFTFSTIVTPLKNFLVYGEFALDQFETPSESDRIGEEGTGDPNAYGWLAGLTYKGFNIEYIYTNPHLYRSTNSWSIYALTRWYHSVYNDSNDIEIEPLGFKYGPDISLLKISSDMLFFNNKLKVYGEYMYILQGEKRVYDYADSGKEAFEMETPTGSVFSRSIITLQAAYNLYDYLSIYGQINGLFYTDITDFQFIIGASYNF